MWTYTEPEAAIRDALRLSEGMTYKNSVAGLHLGGGKGVLVRPPGAAPTGKERTAGLLDFGDAVEAAGGRYLTAEDVGMAPSDIATVFRRTKYVTGRSRRASGSGDPSPMTALGVFASIQASCERAFGSGGLRGRSVAVVGLGHVGLPLARLLAKAGAKLVLADINPARCADAVALGATWRTPAKAMTASVDVLSPCALGGILDAESVTQVQAPVIAGAANNQLSTPDIAALLQRRGVLWAPDFVVNAGGVINIGVEFDRGGYNPGVARKRTLAIATTLHEVLDDAAARKVTTLDAAMDRAKARIAAGR